MQEELKVANDAKSAAFDMCHESESRSVRLERNNRKLKIDYEKACDMNIELKIIIKKQSNEHAVTVKKLIDNVVNNDVKNQVYKTILMSENWENINGDNEMEPKEWINEVSELAVLINKLDSKSSEGMKKIANGIIKLAKNKQKVHAEQWNNFQKIFLEFYFNGKIRVGNDKGTATWIAQKKRLMVEIKNALKYANFSFEMPNTANNLETSAALQIQYCFEKLNKTFKITANVAINILEDFLEFLNETDKIVAEASTSDKNKDITEYLGKKYLNIAADVQELLDIKF